MKWIAYTDGACAPTNPGPSGWGAVLIAPDGSGESDHYGYIGLGTNQIAEIDSFPALDRFHRPSSSNPSHERDLHRRPPAARA